MKKQELINLKKKLEQKVLIFDTWGNEGPYSMYEIEQRINTEGAVRQIENYFENLIDYFSNKKVKYEEMTIYLQFGMFVAEKYVDKKFYIKESAKPVDDLLLVSISGFNYAMEEQIYHEDPESIMKEAYVPFVILFDKFTKLLEEKGFELEGINTFDTITEKIKSNELVKTSITIKFKNKKTKKRTI